jgi:hypothetical protein
MKRVAFVMAMSGTLMGVLAIGTLITGYWEMAPFALATAGVLLIVGAALAAKAGGFQN